MIAASVCQSARLIEPYERPTLRAKSAPKAMSFPARYASMFGVHNRNRSIVKIQSLICSLRKKDNAKMYT